MIADFEARLVDVLGARLPASFTGLTVLAPGAAPGAAAQVVIGVLTAATAEPVLATSVHGVVAPSRMSHPVMVLLSLPRTPVVVEKYTTPGP